MDRILAIGDIHGGLKALLQVMERAEVSTSDRLIFLGDYVDGWSDSAKMIEFAIALSRRQSTVFIKGNHDAWCEEWLRTGIAERSWLFHGGQTTARAYAAFGAATLREHLAFFESMKLYYIDEGNRLFVHAGFTSNRGPAYEPDPVNLMWDRTLWEAAASVDESTPRNSPLYPARLKLFEEVYVGHTPTLYLGKTQPIKGGNAWNLDTGAAFTGPVTIMDIHSHQTWQSDPVQELYPGESGRNKI
jgi:serine/threonine protein phosphatase 1